MVTRRTFALGALSSGVGGCAPDLNRSRAELAQTRAELAELAATEASVLLDTTSSQMSERELLDGFKALYPRLEVEYRRPSSIQQQTRFLNDIAAGHPPPDLLISSAMDLQFKLVNDGYGQAYASPEKQDLPEWAVWNDRAYAITAEPIVFGYNKRLMPKEDVPRSHAEFAELLRRKPDFYRGKIATYDPERSGSGYLYYTQDLLLSRDTLDLTAALARTQPRLYASGLDALNSLSRGDFLLGYNMLSSYLLERQPTDPNIGVVFPSDYTLVTSRIAFIPKGARHPAAARLLLDYLLSETGQSIMARHHIRPVRTGTSRQDLEPPPETLRRIHFGPALLANLDSVRRGRVLREWRRSFDA